MTTASTIESIPVRVEGVNEKATSGEVKMQVWNRDERMKRALKALGLSWGIALLCILIPILHFVLVPLGLIAGPIIAYAIYFKESIILGGEAPCPQCGKPLKIVRSEVKWPLSDLCGVCQAEVKIHRA